MSHERTFSDLSAKDYPCHEQPHLYYQQPPEDKYEDRKGDYQRCNQQPCPNRYLARPSTVILPSHTQIPHKGTKYRSQAHDIELYQAFLREVRAKPGDYQSYKLYLDFLKATNTEPGNFEAFYEYLNQQKEEPQAPEPEATTVQPRDEDSEDDEPHPPHHEDSEPEEPRQRDISPMSATYTERPAVRVQPDEPTQPPEEPPQSNHTPEPSGPPTNPGMGNVLGTYASSISGTNRAATTGTGGLSGISTRFPMGSGRTTARQDPGRTTRTTDPTTTRARRGGYPPSDPGSDTDASNHHRDHPRRPQRRGDPPGDPEGGPPGDPHGNPPGQPLPPVPNMGSRGRAKIKAPEPFDGDRAKARGFLYHLFLLFESQPDSYTTDTLRVVTALSYLGEPLAWYRELLTEEAMQTHQGLTWQAFQDDFLRTFVPIEEEADSGILLQGLTWDTREPIDKFNAEFTRLAYRSGIRDDRALVLLYQMKLPGQLREQVNLTRPTPATFLEWASRATELNHKWHSNRAISQLAGRGRRQTNSTRRTETAHINATQTQPLSKEEQEDARKKGLCFKCKKPGHIARSCPLRRERTRANPRIREITEDNNPSDTTVTGTANVIQTNGISVSGF